MGEEELRDWQQRYEAKYGPLSENGVVLYNGKYHLLPTVKENKHGNRIQTE